MARRHQNKLPSLRWYRLMPVLALVVALAFGQLGLAAANPSSEDASSAAINDLLQSGRYSEAEEKARSMHAALVQSGEGDSTQAAEALDLLVGALRAGGKAGQAETLALAQEVVALWERLVEPDDIRITRSLRNLALLLAMHNDSVHATALQERILAIREKALGPNAPAVGDTLHSLANLKRTEGDYPAAEVLFRRALAILERAVGPDHDDVASCLNDFALDYHDTGNFAEAQRLLERALAIYEKRAGGAQPMAISTLGNLGAVLCMRGDFATAQRTLEIALERAQKTFGPEHRRSVSIMGQLANLLADRGDRAHAKTLYERVIGLDEKLFGSESPRLATSFLNLGLLLTEMGDKAEARVALEHALAIREKALGFDHPDRATVLHALGALLLDAGAPAAEAEPPLTQALDVQERTLGREHPRVASTLASLATLAQKTGDTARARAHLDRAIEIATKNLGPEHPAVALLLRQLALLLEGTSHPEEAGALLDRALSIQERVLGPEHPDVSQTRAALATHIACTGDTAAALDAALGAEEAARAHVCMTVRSLGERQALLYAKTRASGLDLAVTLLVQHPEETATRRRDVLDSIVRSRAIVLDEMASRQRAVVTSGDAEIERLASAVSQARERLAHVIVRGPGDSPLERYRKLAEEARHEKERAEEALATRSVAYREERRHAAIGIDEVEQALPAGAALLTFVRYARRTPADAWRGDASRPDAAYAAFVLKADCEPALVPLGAIGPIDAAVAAWRSAIRWEAQGPGVAPRRSLARYRAAATILRRRIWDPVAALLEGTETVFVVPDGPLHLVNFAALTLDDGRFLVEAGPLVHALSAERDLAALPQASVGSGLLLMGAPEFAGRTTRGASHAFRGAPPTCEGFRKLRFSPLPGAAQELGAIGSLWKQSHTADKSALLVFQGRDADEAAFKDNAPGRSAVHLATHGFVLGEDCAETGGNPLLRSGLALAGSNNRQAAGVAEDGVLTAEEIAALDLRGVEWAVLSACETGLGEMAAGEGVFGLRRAFQVAGARTVVMSLWPVDDAATRTWMERLYRGHLRNGLSTMQAVRRASLDVLRSRRQSGKSTHPFYWAGFLAVGDWR